MSRSVKLLPLALAISAVTLAPAAQAQQLEEVIVTAQKRAESLQDVPISVSAIGGKQIQDAGIPDLTALADYVPNLHIATASVNTNIYMRGVGSGNNQAFEQSVGMYIDGVYMGRGRQYRAGFLDIERVEVLRGPQGTLFGKNTVAGAVNITTASPDVGGETTGEIMASFEENGGQNYQGFISGGLSETLAARLAFNYRETDGYLDNAQFNIPEGGKTDEGVRLTLAWEPSDSFSANLKLSHFEGERIGSNSSTQQYLAPSQRAIDVPNNYRPGQFAFTAYQITDMFYPNFGEIAARDFTSFKDNNYGQSKADGIGISFKPDSSEDSVTNAALALDWDLENHTLTSITAYTGYEYEDDVDVDWLPLQFIARYDDQKFDQFSQELRLASDGGGMFDYVVGAYYEQSELEFYRRVTFDTNFDGFFPLWAARANGLPDAAAPLMPQNLVTVLTQGAYNANQVSRNHDFGLDSESYALFAQGTFNLSDSLRLTLGLRYTEESKDVVSSQRLGDSINGLDGKGSGYSPFLGIVQSTSFNTYNYDYVDGRTTDALTPSANLQWDVNGDSMVYVSFSQGFKSGGFSAADDGEPAGFTVGQLAPTSFVATTPNADFEFDDETVDALEIGGKHELLDGALRINWAAFYTEYDDLQTSIFKGVGFGVKNAASSEVQGIEVESLWQVTNDLRLGLSFAYLDATYGSFADGPCTAIQLDFDPACGTPAGTTSNDLTGAKTLYASDHSGSFMFDYNRPMGNNEFFLGGELNWRAEFFSNGDNDEKDKVPAYEKMNLRVGIRGDNWEFMAYGRNIFDEAALAQSFDTPVLAGTHTQFLEEGRVLGARIKYSF